MNKLKFVTMVVMVITLTILVVVFGRSIFTGMIISSAAQPTPSCNPKLWNHVFTRTRLEIITKCTSVTGTVISSFQVNDGDQHIQLLPDNQYLTLLNQKNIELQLCPLVIDPICAHDPSKLNNATLLDAGIDLADGEVENQSIYACRGFVSKVYIPKVGEHVRVTGSYVLDKYHGWMEIHPATKIEVLK